MVYALWVYKKQENGIYAPILWSIHKTKAGANVEKSKHRMRMDAFIIGYKLYN